MEDRPPDESALMRGVFEASPDAIVVIDADGRIVRANAQCSAVFGHDPDDLLGEPVEVLVPPRLREAHPARRGAFTGGGGARAMGLLQLAAVRADGTEFPAEISLAAVSHDGEPLTCATVRDVTARLALQQESDRVREELLATVSHELRTPLTSIIGYTELLLDLGESQVGPAARRMLAIVERNANRELRLVNDLLDLAFLDDREHMDAEPVDLVEVVRAAVDGARVGARGRGLELSSTLAAGVAPEGARALLVTGDEQRLGQVLDNLLSNAVKFTAPGGRVLVDCAPREGDLALSVSDTGTGMEAVEVPQIFDRLYRSPRAVRDQVPGAGLGLSIVDSIVRAHGGRIEVDSEPGVGTTVSVLLPARVEPVA
ncbi:MULTISPECIES: sensor histidine kinase [unclassified Nocardioides]|uniref:sensor histidine kinase n=1 Tax=unclassified Nocardioides TaxID=2615069 RepID=UPI0012EAB773|nr:MULTISPECIES: PAS domain-containing sensor histidine kinase [unclassified Nocardioides]